MQILVIHGPNLDLLGEREPDVYGRTTLKDINQRLRKIAQAKKVRLTFFQSNHEGEIVSMIGESSKKVKGILINPAAYTHTSVAIRDALTAVSIPTVEVHLSNIYARESFRQHSLIAPVALGQVSGFGANSYEWGLLALIDSLKSKKKS